MVMKIQKSILKYVMIYLQIEMSLSRNIIVISFHIFFLFEK